MPKFKQGFTLIELLVVIAILSVLALMGFATFRGLTKTANDTKRRGDVDAIARVMEVKYSNGTYQELQGSDFAAGGKPQKPEGGDYTVSLNQDQSGFQVCASLSDQSEYCKKSTQGVYIAVAPTATPVPTPIVTPTPIPCADSNGLVGYWKFENGSGDTVTDFAPGGSHPGTWNGTGPTHWSNLSQLGSWAGQFNGSDDYVNVGSYGNTLDTSDYSMCAWVNTTSAIGTNAVFYLTGGSTYTGFRAYDGGPGSLYQITARIYSGGLSAGPEWAADTSVVVGNWLHVCVVFDRDALGTIYANGAVLPGGTRDITAASSFGGDLTLNRIGREIPGRVFSGRIDDVRLFNRALSSQEIANLYNGGAGCNLP